MALIKCKECGKQFSDMAEACPNCGYNPTKAKDKALGLKPKGERKSKAVALGKLAGQLLIFRQYRHRGNRTYSQRYQRGYRVI